MRAALYAFGCSCAVELAQALRILTRAQGGQLLAQPLQLWDEFERNKLARETKRGMRENALQGFRCGGRPPYGYTLQRTPHPVAARAKAAKQLETATYKVVESTNLRAAAREGVLHAHGDGVGEPVGGALEPPRSADDLLALVRLRHIAGVMELEHRPAVAGLVFALLRIELDRGRERLAVHRDRRERVVGQRYVGRGRCCGERRRGVCRVGWRGGWTGRSRDPPGRLERLVRSHCS